MIITISEFWFCMVMLACFIAGFFSYALFSGLADLYVDDLERLAESLKSDREDETDKTKCQCSTMKKEKPFNEWGWGEVGQHLVIGREHFGMDEAGSSIETIKTRDNR